MAHTTAPGVTPDDLGVWTMVEFIMVVGGKITDGDGQVILETA